MELPGHPPLEGGGGESIINGSLNSKIIIIICQNGLGKS